MRKLLLIIGLFISVHSFAQFPITQNLGSDSTMVKSKGAIWGTRGVVNGYFVDTIAANLSRIAQYPYAQIITDSGTLKIRNATADGWLSVFGSDGSVTKVRYPLTVISALDSGAPTDSLVIAQSWIDSALAGGGGARYRLDVNYDSTKLILYDSTNNYNVDSVAFNGGSGGTGTVTSVAALTLGTTGTDLSSSVANSTTTPVITLNVPTASASNRGALSSTDWSIFNGKQSALSGTGYSKWAGTTPSYLTPTQVTADLNLFTSSLQGLVPLSGGGTTNFLRADGTWTTPASGGTVSNFSSGNLSPLFTTSVATSTSTPALSFTQSTINQFEILGRKAASSGAYSFLPADSSLISGLHSESYYNGKYWNLLTNVGLAYPDTTMGLGTINNTHLRFKTSGRTVAIIDSLGRLGIGSYLGNSYPTTNFGIKTIAQNATIVNAMRVYNPGSGNNTGARLSLGYADNASSTMSLTGYYNNANIMGFEIAGNETMKLLATDLVIGTGSLPVATTFNNTGTTPASGLILNFGGSAFRIYGSSATKINMGGTGAKFWQGNFAGGAPSNYFSNGSDDAQQVIVGVIGKSAQYANLQDWQNPDSTVATRISNTGSLVIGTNDDSSHSALVALNSVTKGFIPSRMTAIQRDSLLRPISTTVTITNGGSGYVTPATAIATISKRTGEELATVNINITAGVVTGIGVLNPGAFKTIPTVTITGGGGSGATATVILQPLPIGVTIYCKDCTAADTSIGVMQTWNGGAWKNNW